MMKIMRMIGLSIVGLSGVASLGAYSGLMAKGAVTKQPKAESSVVDTMGNLRVPEHYRTSYQFLGSWAIASDSGKGSKQIHNVYASPGTIATYRKDGRFPDGAVLIKEVFQATTQPMKTGTVSHADKLAGWFVMVKESNNIHPTNKLWGDGWAWSWFNADNPTKTTSTNFKVDCLPCHEPARATDWIYVLGYPPLHGAR
jgi:hypothetical protein